MFKENDPNKVISALIAMQKYNKKDKFKTIRKVTVNGKVVARTVQNRRTGEQHTDEVPLLDYYKAKANTVGR